MTTEPQIWERSLGGLRPFNEAAERVIKRLKIGSHVRTNAVEPHNIRFHNKFWKLLSVVADNVPGLTTYSLAKLIELRTGHFDVIQTKSGIVRVPRSISFTNMEEPEFEKLWNDMVIFLCEEILPVSPAELEAAVTPFIAGP